MRPAATSRRARPWWAIALGLLSLLTSPALAATADSGPTPPRNTLSADLPVDSTGDKLLVRTPPRAFTAGQRVQIVGRATATSNQANVPVGQTAYIRCTDTTTGAIIGTGGSTTRNHQGSAFAGYATKGVLPITVNWLFVAPADGTYRCSLHGSIEPVPGAVLTFLAGSTWITMSVGDQPNAKQWTNAACGSNGVSGCTYLGGSRGGVANPTTYFVFYTGLTPESWYPTSWTTGIEAIGDVSLTTCYQSTKSCDLSGGQLPRDTDAIVDTRLELIQINAGGTTCVLTTGPAAGTGTSPNGAYQRTVIRDDAHHIKLYHRIPRASISTACGTEKPRFIVRIRVNWISGQPVKIDGLLAGARNQLTNAIAMQVP